MSSLMIKPYLIILAIVGGAAGGYYIANSELINQKSTIGETSAKYTTKNQWRFLYHLAFNIFEEMKKSNNFKTVNANNKPNVVEWLEDRMQLNNQKDSNLSSDWRGFKRVCDLSLSTEDLFYSQVNKPESRFCFMGVFLSKNKLNYLASDSRLKLDLAAKKGFLKTLYFEKTNQTNNPFRNFHFYQFNKTNFELWESFISSDESLVNDDIKDSVFEERFNEWYNSPNTIIRTLSEDYVCILKNWNYDCNKIKQK